MPFELDLLGHLYRVLPTTGADRTTVVESMRGSYELVIYVVQILVNQAFNAFIYCGIILPEAGCNACSTASLSV
jgi:hypothetical protein